MYALDVKTPVVISDDIAHYQDHSVGTFRIYTNDITVDELIEMRRRIVHSHWREVTSKSPLPENWNIVQYIVKSRGIPLVLQIAVKPQSWRIP